MAGHSKFKNIMHRKGAQDTKRAKIFTKIGREIQVAAKIGGGDVNANPRLRAAIALARENNMPNDRIKRSIDAGTGVGDTADYVDIRYEGYGVGGVAVIVEALTDNKNRTASEVRSTFDKCGGNLGETGSVSFMFDRVGQILFYSDKISADQIFEAAVEAGADNVDLNDEGQHEVICTPDLFAAVKESLEKVFGASVSSGLIWKPNITTQVSEDQAEQILKLIDMLEESDDVQNVTTNFVVSDEIMAKMAQRG
jgi:YebC/PmpR family DNA-binding regulatory protein